jgi:NlpE N-terminal domain
MSKSRRLLVGAIFSTFVLIFLPFQPAGAYLVTPGEYPIHGTYRGVLPCADCVGVWTEVILVDFGPFEPGQGSGTFTSTERFTGGVHGGASITTHGKWSTIKWDGFGAGTIELRIEDRDGKHRAPQRFYCDHGRSLRLLFSKTNEIVFNRQDTLERVIPPPLPQFILTDRDNNAPIIGRVGDAFQIDLPTTLAHENNTWVMKQPVSRSMALEGQLGSGILPDHATTTFFLRAIAPGNVRIEFQRVKGPSMMLASSFEITR